VTVGQGRRAMKVSDGWHEVMHWPAAALTLAFVIRRRTWVESATEILHDSFTTQEQEYGA
jgi:hypothetical protein